MVDLHCHSRYSDGTYDVKDLLMQAEQSGITVLALTDHDTIDGIEPFLKTESHVKKIPGIEISIDWNKGTFHLVGLFIDHKNQKLNETIDKLKQFRRERNNLLLQKLSELIGKEVKMEDISEENYGELGRPHIAQFMIKKGLVKTIEEAFEKYLGKGKSLYVPKKRLYLENASYLIKTAGGISIIAHPITIEIENEDNFFKMAKDLGVDGIEVYCSLHSEKEVAKYMNIAEKYNFLISLGSDFHGTNKKDVLLGKHGCDENASLFYYQKMLEYIGK